MRAFFFALAFWAAAPAFADEADDIERARRLVEVELRFGEAAEALEGLAQKPLPTEQKIEVYRLLGIAYVAKDAPEAAQAAFGALLDLDPSFNLDPRLSPKILDVFHRVKARLVERPKLLDVVAALEANTLTWRGRLEDPMRMVKEVVLYSRRPPEAYLGASVAVDSASEMKAQISAGDPDGELRVEYYLIAKDSSGRIVAQLGSPEAPSSVVVERAPPQIVAPPTIVSPAAVVAQEPELYERWWFWVAVGALAVGTGVGLVVTSGTEVPGGTLEAIELD